MKRLLIVTLICLNAQTSHCMNNVELKTFTAEQSALIEEKMKAERVQIASHNVSFPKIEHLKINAQSIAMSRNHRVVLAEGKSVVVHDFEGNVLCSHLLDKDLDGTIVARTISDDGRFVAFADITGKIGVIDLDKRDKSPRYSRELPQASQLAFDHQSKNLVVLGLENYNSRSDQINFSLLDKDLKLIKKNETFFSENDTEDEMCNGCEAQIAISIDGTCIVAATPHSLFFWNTENNQVRQQVTQVNRTNTFITSCDDNTFAVLSVSTEKSERVVGEELYKHIVSIYNNNGKVVKELNSLSPFSEDKSKILNIWDAQLTATPDGLRIFLNGQGKCVIVDVDNCKFLHTRPHTREEPYSKLCCAGYNGVIKYREPSSAEMYKAVVYETITQTQARKAAAEKRKADELTATLRKKRIIIAVTCVAGALAAYAAWKKFKKKKKSTQNFYRLSASKI
jgi:hypothetical protein